MNSYHGKVLRFIGMTVLSGLVAASLAPASFAAPSDSQETNTETQVSATVLSYPGTNGPTPATPCAPASPPPSAATPTGS